MILCITAVNSRLMSVIMLNVIYAKCCNEHIMLSVIVLSVVMLIVVMLNVMAPTVGLSYAFYDMRN
jgi:hypothetical protein